MTEKELLRREFSQRRKRLSEAAREAANEAIFHRLIGLCAYRNAQTVMPFVSFGDEADTHRFIRFALSEGKTVFVPCCEPERDEMTAVQIRSMDELILGKHGILAPVHKPETQPDPQIDLVLAPGLAFDKAGYRLGYGRGYYDRFFESLSEQSIRIGVGFELQLTAALPHEPFDVPLHAVVTEERVLWAERK